MHISSWASLFLSLAITSKASSYFDRRQLPKEQKGIKTIKTANNATIRYKEPGICETTPGVKSYSGYVDTSPASHVFFWFFEARHDPENAPTTLWLNGGPGSDSLQGLFQELGPCQIQNKGEEYVSRLNPHSWNEASNMLFISQPIGVGYSYSKKGPGVSSGLAPLGPIGTPAKVANGRWPLGDPFGIDTTELVAKAAWEVIQGFYSGLPKINSDLKSKTFNLWTESYGGHYGPAFFDHFYQENQRIKNGTTKGVQLEFGTLGIMNGLIDSRIQSEYYYKFANNNTYGIKSVPDDIYTFMKMSNEISSGCLGLIDSCRAVAKIYGNIPTVQSKCAEAAAVCQYSVTSPYYTASGRGSYDIRVSNETVEPPEDFLNYLNSASVMEAIGVDLNYTKANNAVLQAFRSTGDIVLADYLEDIEKLLSRNIRVTLVYGDADYTCNWFGGEAISLALKYKHSKQFHAAGYQPFIVNGTEYGVTREYGNLSFTRIYNAGHMVPYYQPDASLQFFNRSLHGWDLPTGQTKLTSNSDTSGPASAAHTQSSVGLPSSTAKVSGTGSVRRSFFQG